ncbi:Hsp20/alpha crystallin family protein [Tissierella creatinini]|nr:Hsp20/alpha crystallin family protein [Tissierella creatinini]TJX63576.1 Hsp20/alpha crystallin family protein [Soehngenia saccharolytica]
MSRLVPFNRRSGSLINSGFGDFYNMVDNFFNDNWLSTTNFIQGSFKINIKEDEKEYTVEAELPGVKKEEIKLELNEGKLNIAVERESKVEEEKNNYVHKESSYASMKRSIYLADAASDDISAKLDNGILTIAVPKKQKTDNTKHIEIE